MAIAAAWSARVMTISAEMVIPGLVGLWIDGKLGTKVVFTLLGFGLGMVIGLMHTLRMVAPSGEPNDSSKQKPGSGPDN